MNKMSLADCAERNDIESLKVLLKSHKNINEFEYDRSALHSACVANSIGAAELLIKEGIDVDLPDRITGATPLHYCSVYNYFDIAKLILENEGRLDIADNYGNEPLWTAVFNVKGKEERLPIVELYLKYGANKNHKNQAGRSPLDFAVQVNFLPLLKILNGIGR